MELLDSQPILIRELDGREVPFDPADLQQKLEQCFIEAGLAEQRYLAEDFVRSVEYTLANRRNETPVGRSELNMAVVGALEETGFPAVASVYRVTGGVREIKLRVTLPVVQEVLTRFVAGAPVAIEKLSVRVCEALSKLSIRQVSPKLVVELARHYWWEEAQGVPLEAATPPAAVSAAEILSYSTQEARQLVIEGILVIHGITPILPALRFELGLCPLVKKLSLTPPVLELELAPELYRISGILAACREQILKTLGKTQNNLPLFLDFPDMSDFVAGCLAGERIHFRRTGREIVRMVVSSLPDGLPLQIKMN